VFGQSWAQEPAQRPPLEKRYMKQRKLARDIDSKAPRKKKQSLLRDPFDFDYRPLTARRDRHKTLSSSSLASHPKSASRGKGEVGEGYLRGIPKWFLGQVACWRPGVPRPKNQSFLENVCFLGLDTPGLQQKNLANKTRRDPFDYRPLTARRYRHQTLSKPLLATYPKSAPRGEEGR
jgi:hypothetical protein